MAASSVLVVYFFSAMMETKQPVTLTIPPIYKKECGSCHMAFPPNALPVKSWKIMKAGLQDHFGDDASIEESSRKGIEDYLVKNSAEKSLEEASIKFIRSIGKENPPWLSTSFRNRIGDRMTENKKTVERYMDGFIKSDHAQILSCLTEDVEWEMPGAFHLVGKDAFDEEIENDAFVGSPTITITRMVEENDVVIAEGAVRAKKKDGDFLNAVFCDVFVMENAKIKRLTTYLAEVKL
jgi:uncharacterized protein